MGHRDTYDGHCFPIYSSFGEEVGLVKKEPNREVPYYTIIFQEFRGDSYFFNEKCLPSLFYGTPIVIVEGVWDCLSVIQETGLPCIAMNTNHLRIPMARKLRRYTDKIIFWLDSDQGGEDGLKVSQKNIKIFQLNVRIFRSNLSKDANDILQTKQGQQVFTDLKKTYKEFEGGQK